MNIKLLLFLTALLLYNHLIYGLCDDCNYTDNIIVPIGNTSFEANITADEYYWEICEGSANIIGSNTSPTVLVKNVFQEDYTIKLIQFNNGNCTVTCKDVIGDPCVTAACPQSSNLGFFAEPDMDPCFEGIISIVGLTVGQNFCIDYVNWSWSISGSFPQAINGGDTSENIFFFGDGSSIITICANVFYKNGTACNEICRSFDLPESCNCGDPGEPPCP